MCVHSCTINSERADISEWVSAHNEVAQTIDFRQLSIGPYFHMKGARYFYVKTDKNTYWFKYLWGRSIEKEVNGKYQTIE